MEAPAPTVEQIRAARERLRELVAETPLWRWRGDAVEQAAGRGTQVLLKLELFQHAGSFKPRGALCAMMDLAPDALRRGVTAVSAGNHAMAVGYAARALGTATMGLEICEQARELDAVIVPIGGGGLCAGVASAVKQILPRCAVYGVEPEGADSMHRSFASGKPESIDAVRTIADSLGAPHAAPYSFALCRRYVDRLVKVDDGALRSAMGLLFRSAKLAVEPAGAAATAALCGPLRETLSGKRVAVIVCGANIDAPTFAKHLGVP